MTPCPQGPECARQTPNQHMAAAVPNGARLAMGKSTGDLYFDDSANDLSRGGLRTDFGNQGLLTPGSGSFLRTKTRIRTRRQKKNTEKQRRDAARPLATRFCQKPRRG